MEAEALNCPNCGAAVASDHTQCEFCKTRLKTMACPSCFGLMFIGSKFCDHCGAIATPVEVSLDGNEGECPRCRKKLETMKVAATTIRGCEACDGLWMDVATFEHVCADREEQSAVLGFLEKRTIRDLTYTKVNYVPCPDCGQLMNRNNFARASGVIVDVCKPHGVWFDADELPKIIEFIQKGGMKIAREREINELQNERARLHNQQQKLTVEDEGAGVGDLWDDNEQHGIRSFIRALFE